MKLPVTVVSGYLGAGKTTMINHLLRHAGGLRLAVLVNEFGALPIDADLIEAEEDGLVSISGGCVCCAYGSDMIGVLEDIRDATPGFDHVLLEASGVALPGAIMTTVGLVAGLRPDATLVLADAEQIRRNAASRYLSDTVLRQLAQADIVIVTKTDLVERDRLAEVEEWLKAQAPGARLLRAAHGAVPPEAALGAVPLARRVGGPATSAHGAFASVVLTPDRPVDAGKLAARLAAREDVTRAKGFVETPGGLALVHVVGGRAEVEVAEGPRMLGVVCIGAREAFDPEGVEGVLEGL